MNVEEYVTKDKTPVLYTSRVRMYPAGCMVDMKWTAIEHFRETRTHLKRMWTWKGRALKKIPFIPIL